MSAVMACKKPTPTPTPSAPSQPTTTTVDAASAAAVTQPNVVVDPGVAPAPNGPIAAPIGEDLVRRLRLTVRASSVTDPSTSADKMIDNDLATAWNSRTGDLVGAWFEVTVPAGVTVSSFAMTAGFTRQNGRNDLFLMNHRVERVRVSKDGVELGEFALNPDGRALQTFALLSGAGTYRFTISAERAGTRANWRELCVSEFVLYGTVPEGMAPLSDGDAGDGDAGDRGAQDTDASAASDESDGGTASSESAKDEQPTPLQPTAPEALTAEPMVADVGAFCTAMQRRNFRRAACNAASADAGRAACFCGQMPGATAPPTFTTSNRQASLQRPASPFTGAYFMARTPNPDDTVLCDLLVRTPAGLFPFASVAECAPSVNAGGEHPSVHVRRMRAVGGDAGPAELTVEWTETHERPTRSRNWVCTGQWTARCTVDASNVPSCTKVLNAAETCTAAEGGGVGDETNDSPD
jgi:hypothetical protein